VTAVLAPPVTRAPFTVADGGLVKKPFARTDLGNAERFVAQHGTDVRWVPAWSKWLLWDESRWRIDETLDVMRLAHDTVRRMYVEVGELPSLDARKDLTKHAVRSEADAKLRAMLDQVKAQPGIAITPAMLNRDPWLLACENGTIDLRTGQLKAHERDDLMTKVVPCAYAPGAECFRWEAFLSRVLAGNQELIDFVQRAVGYSLTGLTSERALFFLYGSGANGKSTFLEICRALLAGYASQADFTTFLERKGDGPRNDIARLFGARLVTSSEVGEGKKLNESLVKTLTGDETVTARFLHAEFFEFKPAFKLWLAANHKPVIRGTDNAIWDRIRLIPFTVAIPADERDRNLGAALMRELPGILAWAVGGAVLWHQHGLGTASSIREATDSYRRESDALGAFIEERCELNPLQEEPASTLFAAWDTWCSQSGEFKGNARSFGQALDERGVTRLKRGGKIIRVGIRLCPS
jgi:putative DNA primase/helicase